MSETETEGGHAQHFLQRAVDRLQKAANNADLSRRKQTAFAKACGHVNAALVELDTALRPDSPADRPALNRILWNHGRETVDEIVIGPCFFHLEQMSDNSYWIGVTRDQRGGGEMLHIDLYTKRAPISCTIRDEDWEFDIDREH